MRMSRLLTVSVITATALLLGGCANPGTGPEATGSAVPTAKYDEELHALLPEDLRDRSELIVATNAPFPPYEMFASPGSEELIGLEIDLGNAIGEKLGVPFIFEQQPFDGLVPGLAAGKYDLVMATLFATEERAQSMRFVTFAQSGGAIMVRADNDDIATIDDLCGRTVAVQNGSTQADFLATMNTDGTCDEPVEVQQFPSFSDERLALSSGKVDAAFHDLPPVADAAAADATLKVLSDPDAPGGYDSQLIGIGVPLDQPRLQQAILRAAEELQADGIYDDIFAKWNLDDSRVEKPAVDEYNG